jgi:predicted dehydrogenase
LDNKIKWGIIGSGGIARRRTIPEGIIKSEKAELIAVYDVNPEVNTAVAQLYNATAAKSLTEFFESEIEAIYIASPVNVHFDQVIRCAQNKKHILCEKPLGMTVKEAEKMISVCKKEGVLLGTGFMMRFQTQHREALKLIQKGKLGEPVYGRAQLSCWYPPLENAWRQDPKKGGGGALIDMGSHCIDLLEMFYGNIKSVSCFINNSVHSYKSEDSAVVLLSFENGAMATVDTYFCIPDNSSKNLLELYGSKGSIIARGTIGQGPAGEMTAYLDDDQSGYDAGQSRNIVDGILINPEPVNTYFAEIEEFNSAILEKREPMNSAEIGLRNQKVISSCYKSARTGKAINIK